MCLCVCLFFSAIAWCHSWCFTFALFGWTVLTSSRVQPCQTDLTQNNKIKKNKTTNRNSPKSFRQPINNNCTYVPLCLFLSECVIGFLVFLFVDLVGPSCPAPDFSHARPTKQKSKNINKTKHKHINVGNQETTVSLMCVLWWCVFEAMLSSCS